MRIIGTVTWDHKFTTLTGLKRPKRQQIGEWLKIPDGRRHCKPGFMITVIEERMDLTEHILKVGLTLLWSYIRRRSGKDQGKITRSSGEAFIID